MNILKKPLALSMASMLLMSASYLHAQQTVSYTYNDNGQILTIDGSRTDVSDISSYTYNAEGYRASITNALGHIITLSDFNGRGQAQLITDANGIDTRLTYHVRGWLLSSEVVDPADTGDGSLNARTDYTYNHVGNITRITLPNGVFLNYDYDTSNRLVAISNNLGEKISYTLDNAGNRLSQTIRDSGYSLRYSMTRAYDELSRVMEVVGAEGQTTHINYDVNNNAVQSINPRNYTSHNTYDPLDRLTHTTDANSGVTQFGYDNQDRLTTVTDANGHITAYIYDAFDNVIEQRSPDTGITTYSYDSANNRIRMTDARGITVNYTYDAINRLTHIHYPDYPEENVTYEYDRLMDTNGNLIHGIGRLVNIIDQSGRSHYHYDHRGNVIRYTQTIGQDLNDPSTVSYTTQYQYDLADQRIQMTYPNGLVTTYTRDNLGRISGIATQAANDEIARTVVDNVQYLPFGGVNRMTYGNGITTTLHHDQDYRLYSLISQGDHDVVSLNYYYDANNNIIQIDNGEQQEQQDFAYDMLDRLEQVNNPSGQFDYAYDFVGNRSRQQFLSSSIGRENVDESYHQVSGSNQLSRIDRLDSGVSVGNQLSPSGQTVIVDDVGSNPYESTYWHRYTGFADVYGGHAQFSYHKPATFTWQVDIPAEGDYALEARWFNHYALTDSATFSFSSMDGQQYHSVAQLENGNQWNRLGVHRFAAGTVEVTVSNSGYGVLAADAIQVIPQLSNTATVLGDSQYELDTVGNTLSDIRSGHHTSYSYNAANRPVTAITNTVGGIIEANYRYNALGQRVSKHVVSDKGDVTTHYIYNVSGQLLSEVEQDAHAHRQYIHLNGQAIAVQDSNIVSGEVVIVDDLDDSQVSIEGEWRNYSGSDPYNGHSQYSYDDAARFSWSIPIEAAGEYELQARWITHQNLTDSVSYHFVSIDGNQTRMFNQKHYGGQWNSLGVHYLPQGTLTITAENTGYGYIGADAVQLIPQRSITALNRVVTKRSYIHNDHLGTPIVMTNESQEKVWEARYTAFGEAILTMALVEQNLRFAGQYFDQETNLHYNYFRYYDPKTGRYTQSDPIGLDGGINTYLYANANPIIYTDPYGLLPSGKPTNLGGGNSVRIDGPHVPGQQKHAHVKTPKGNAVINQDGTQSHKNKGKMDNLNKKVKKYLKDKGFNIKSPVWGPAFFWEATQEACRQGIISGAACSPENDPSLNISMNDDLKFCPIQN